MINNKPAKTKNPINPIIANRWSPLSYSDKPVEKEKIMSLLEAARWAPSCFNEQPWNYVIGYKGDEIYEKLARCLSEGNQWAKTAPVLILSIAKKFFEHKHKPNRHAMYDTGAATVLITIQATELDLVTHQMAGLDQEKVRELFKINADYEPAAMMAIGYYGDPDKLPPNLKERDQSPRSRKPLKKLIWEIE